MIVQVYPWDRKQLPLLWHKPNLSLQSRWHLCSHIPWVSFPVAYCPILARLPHRLRQQVRRSINFSVCPTKRKLYWRNLPSPEQQQNSNLCISGFWSVVVCCCGFFFLFFPFPCHVCPATRLHFTGGAGLPWASHSSSCPQMPIPELLQRWLNCSWSSSWTANLHPSIVNMLQYQFGLHRAGYSFCRHCWTLQGAKQQQWEHSHFSQEQALLALRR